MRFFISGVAGFLGSHLADALLASGHHVSGIDNMIGGSIDNVPRGVDLTICDCNDFDTVKKAMRACDLVYHFAATAHEGLSVFSPHENAHNGYAASASVFSAACTVGVKRVIFSSSMARYGRGDGPPPFVESMSPKLEDPYGIGKVASEQLLRTLCEEHGIEWVIAVPHNLYGPRQCYSDPFRNVLSIFANLMLQGRQPFIYGDGSQERCFSFISDVVDPFVQMGLSDVAGEVVNIGPDKEVVTILDAAKLVATVVGFQLDPVFLPSRPREVKIAHCSADKARRLLGYEARVPLSDGIEETVNWIRDRGPKPFNYKLDIEIESNRLPETWSRRLL